MALQLITGVSGSGKSTLAFDMVTEVALSDRNKNVFVLVPDQFSQEAGRILIEKNSGGILNIDVLSFRRLAYRALEEFRAQTRTILSDEGKMMLLRRVIAEHKDELSYFKKGLDRPGFLDECKSLLSEFETYGIGEDEIFKMKNSITAASRSGLKFADLGLIYREFEKKLGDSYRTSEELIPMLINMVPKLSFLEDATVCLDDFTGFTPVQYDLIKALLKRCKDVIVTVTTDRGDGRKDVFSLSDTTVKKLTETAKDASIAINETIHAGDDSYRLKDNRVLDFVERHLFSYDGSVYDEKAEKEECSDHLRLRVCRTMDDEASFVAKEIKQLISDGVKPEAIAVVSADVDGYLSSIKRYFEAYELPYFTDTKKSFGMNPLAELVFSFLDMLKKGFDTSSVIRFLRGGLSPVTDKNEVDIFENYLLASGRRGYNAFTKKWTYQISEERMELTSVNATRERFAESVSDAVNSIKGGRKTVKEFAVILFDFLIKNNTAKRLREQADLFDEKGEALIAAEYRRLYPSLMNVADSMVDLLGDVEVNLTEFTELISAGINDGVMGFVPPSSHQVLVGDMMRSRLGEVEYIFLLGNNDHYFPKNTGSKGILTDKEREIIQNAGIELAPSAKELFDQEMFYFYRLLAKPKKMMYLTYMKMDRAGKDVRPSYLIDRVASLFSGLLVTEDDEKEKVKAGVPGTPVALDKREAYISSDTAKGLYGSSIRASVTRFESFVRCPYSHFLTYGLGLRERDTYEIQANDRGSVFHDALEAVVKRMSDEGTDWNTIKSEKLKQIGEEVFDQVCDGYRDDLFHQDKRKEYAKRRMKRVYLDALEALRNQMATGRFHQEGFEESFDVEHESADLPDGLSVRLRGRIDRYDVMDVGDDRYIKLVDYKSSGRELNLCGVYYGLEMQLLTYMKVLINAGKNAGKNVLPAAVYYQKIDESDREEKNAFPDAEKLAEIRLKNFRPSGYTNGDTTVISGLDPALLAGGTYSVATPLRTKNDGTYYKDSVPKVLTKEQFDMLIKKTGENITACAGKLYEGHIEARPHAWNEESGKKTDSCAYCPYAGVCGIEIRTKESMENKRDYLSDEKVWEELS